MTWLLNVDIRVHCKISVSLELTQSKLIRKSKIFVDIT